MAGRFLDLIGTVFSKLQIAIGGVQLKNSSGNLLVRNPGDSADADVTTNMLHNSGDTMELNSDAAGSGADWKLTLARPSSGMTAAWTFKFPTTPGTANYVLQTDGSGNTSWVAAGSTASCDTIDTTSLAHGSTSPVTMFTLPANAVINLVRTTIDTAFDGTPTMSVGVSGTTSKYVTSSEVDLTAGANTVFDVAPGQAADGSTEALIITYSAGGATVGAARVEVFYDIPA